MVFGYLKKLTFAQEFTNWVNVVIECFLDALINLYANHFFCSEDLGLSNRTHLQMLFDYMVPALSARLHCLCHLLVTTIIKTTLLSLLDKIRLRSHLHRRTDVNLSKLSRKAH